MDAVHLTVWIAACAHALQQRLRTVDPAQFEEAAGDLWSDVRLRTMPPKEAAETRLEPVNGSSLHHKESIPVTNQQAR